MLYIETGKRRVYVTDSAAFGSRFICYLRYPGESDYQAQLAAVAKFNRRYAPVVTIGQQVSGVGSCEARLTRPVTTGDN
jgi:hypothetical protein